MFGQISFYIWISVIVFALFAASLIFWLITQAQNKKLLEKLQLLTIRIEERDRLHSDLQQNLQQQSRAVSDQQLSNLKTITSSIQEGMADIRNQINLTLNNNAEYLGKSVEKLTQYTQQQLQDITKLVEKRLFEGFEKTTTVFTDIVKRLALIDEAQKKITELSGSVISLQEILVDKRSRGAFGEIQLEHLIQNIMPAEHFSFQHTLNNGKRVDCMLFLPEPTGNIAIDAKFPLESYQKMTDHGLHESERKTAAQQFGNDIRKHIKDIAEKYIIEGETAVSALMFIPAEAIFAEIHAHHPELVELSHRTKVWMVSPTTMMAVLSTARSVLKDIATRKQINIIQQHLIALSRHFETFQKSMDNLAKHINQAHADVEAVQKSSQKITSQFNRIEQIEFVEEKAEV